LDVPAGGFRFNSLRRVPHPTTPDEVKDFRNGSLRVLRVLRGGASSSFNPQTATAKIAFFFFFFFFVPFVIFVVQPELN